MNTEINVTNEIINIDTTTSVIDVNVTNEIIVIEATQGAYPLPATVYSVFGRTGDVVALEGDYDLSELGDVVLTSPITGQVLKFNGTSWVNGTDINTDLVTSVFGRIGAITAQSGDYTTSLVTEGTNLYYTDGRARASLSAGTGISYSTTTGVISSTITQYTDALARNAISLTTSGTSGAATYSPSTGVLNVPQYAPDLSGYVPTSRTLTINGTTYDLSANRSWSINSMVYPSSGIAVSTGTAWGTSIADNSINWNTAYNRSIVSAAVTGTTTKTLTLNEQDGSTITASWTDINTDAVTSVFGRTGAVVATSGDYSTNQVTENTNLYFTDARARAALSLTTTGTSGVATYNSTTGAFNIPNYSTDLSGYVPYTGATANVNLGVYSLTANALIKNGGVDTQFLKADGSVDNNTYLTANDLPSTLTLYATNVAASVSGYFKLVTTIDDPDFNTTAVDISTGEISTTTQLIASLVSPANLINGNPGVFNVTTIGDIKKVSGSGEAEFYFEIYKRTSAGVETMVGISGPTLPVVNSGYAEFSATALWNDGTFDVTDTIVLKFYGARIAGGSNPTYNFQFGGVSPVRTIVPIPTAVIPNIYLEQLADVEDGTASNNDGIYYDTTASLWKYKSIATVLGYTPQAELTLTTTGTSGAATLIGSTLNIPQYSGGGGSMAIGGSITGATTGSVLFVNSGATLAQDNANFFWDATNDRLGIGTATPLAKADINGQLWIRTSAGGAITGGGAGLKIEYNTTGDYGNIQAYNYTTGVVKALLLNSGGGNVGINTGTVGSQFQVNGNAAIGYSASTAAPTNGLLVNGNVQLAATKSFTGTAGSYFYFGYPSEANGPTFVMSSPSRVGGPWTIGYDASGGHKFANSDESSVWMLINSSGNIGIGTQTIGSKLQINGNAAIGYSASTAAPTNGLQVAGDIQVAGTGSTTTTPRIVGINGFGAGNAARFQFGDSLNCFQNSNGGVMQLISYHGMQIYGGRGGVVTSFAAGVSTDPSLIVAGTEAARPVLVVRAAASQSANIQQWRNSSNTVLASMSNTGSITAVSFIKTSGTSAQILAADGSVITAGTNITISGGTISATGGGGSITLSAIGSTPNSNAATLTGSALNLEPASASFGGVVTTGVQTFGGAKTFDSSITALSIVKSGGTSAQYLMADGSVTTGTGGTVSVTIGQAVVSGTENSILFVGAGNVLAQDNANFSWNDTTNKLNIGGDALVTGVLSQTIVTNRQTASYTLALTDRSKLVEMNVATANNLTVPLNSSVAYPIGTEINIVQYGAGQTTIVATGGVTIRSTNNWVKLNARYGAVTLIKIDTDEWYLFGNLNA